MESYIGKMDLAPPRGATQTVTTSLTDSIPDSKRGYKIEKQDADLSKNMSYLDETTRAKNRIFQDHLDAIEERMAKLEIRLRAETADREEKNEQLHNYIKEKFETTWKTHHEAVENTYEGINKQQIPPLQEQQTWLEDDVSHFVNSVVIEKIEEQTGKVRRKLEKERENFKIENTKVMKRETKLKQKFEQHKLQTAQSFEDERATRIHKFLQLNEDIYENERVNNREEEKMVTRIMKELKNVRLLVEAEAQVRETEDCAVLDSMLDAQHRMQGIILQNFGQEAIYSEDY